MPCQFHLAAANPSPSRGRQIPAAGSSLRARYVPFNGLGEYGYTEICDLGAQGLQSHTHAGNVRPCAALHHDLIHSPSDPRTRTEGSCGCTQSAPAARCSAAPLLTPAAAPLDFVIG